MTFVLKVVYNYKGYYPERKRNMNYRKNLTVDRVFGVMERWPGQTLGVVIISVIVLIIAYNAAVGSFDVPTVYYSHDRGTVVRVEGKDGKPLPPAEWSNILKGGYNKQVVP